jgi:hypothetical protein
VRVGAQPNCTIAPQPSIDWRERHSYREDDALNSLFPKELAMSDSGYLTSHDLALLKEVFDETCAKNEVSPESPAASNLAKALIVAFENGIRDKAGLLAIVAKWAA